MGSSVSKTVTTVLLGTFVLWYLLRQTTLGQAYTADMLAIPRSFAAGEGLNSAGRYQ